MDSTCIADCRLFEQAAEERLATFVAFFQNAPMAMFLLDEGRRVREVNRAAEAMLGTSAEGLKGRRFGDAVQCNYALDDPDGCGVGPDCENCSMREVVNATFETGQMQRRVEAQLVPGAPPASRGGAVLISTSLTNAQGDPQVLVCIEDISEHKQITENLTESNARFRLACDTANIAFCTTDLEGRFTMVNTQMCRTFGYTEDEFLRISAKEITYAEDMEATRRFIRQAASGEVKHGRFVKRYVRKDGRILWGEVSSSTLPDAQGNPQYFVTFILDITERKLAEEALRKSHDRLTEALQEVEQLKDRLQEENVYLREEIRGNRRYDEIVGQSELLRLALGKIEHVASTNANVLLLGETGTGKELFARAIHNQSPRKQHPLVKVNCAALPSSLIESELFGHVKGAFSGAINDKMGRFELAAGGTIFLDEIGELDLDLQSKLLRVLQEGEFERVGATETLKADVRVIAATNRDVQEAMHDGSFRPDLYYRLAVFPVEIPPLRLRREDIPLLVWHFIDKKQRGLGRTISRISKVAMKTLTEYDWPGNVRELENVVERAMILSAGPTLTLEGAFAQPVKTRRTDGSPCNLEDVERAHIVGVLEDCEWRIKGADNTADRLGLKPSTLHYRMKKLGIQRPPRRPR